MIIPNDAPNSQVLAFFESLVNALSTTSHSKGAYTKYVGSGTGGFYKFFKKKSSPVNHRPKYFMTQ